jgi:hypothetical protein
MKIQVFSFFNSEKKVVIVVLSGRNLDLRKIMNLNLQNI